MVVVCYSLAPGIFHCRCGEFPRRLRGRRIGEMLAQQWVLEARESFLLVASLGPIFGMQTHQDLLPLEMRFDLKALEAHTKAVREAYARVNLEAERSGEPVYPPAS